MAKYYVLYNPLSNNKRGEKDARKIENIIKDGEFQYKSVLEIESFEKTLSEVSLDETIVLAGGDGTLNRFINSVDTDNIKREIIYFPAGSGNDFMHDVSVDDSMEYLVLNKYIENLPYVEVNGMKKRFINGIGYGIDGYACEEADRIRNTSGKHINYTMIAAKGLLYAFKPLNATVCINGEKHEFKDTWLAPTMNGRFYGGGMMAAPMQNRLNQDGTLSTIIFTGSSRLRLLTILPSIFDGTHVKHTDKCSVFTGKDVEVSFDKPCALQIDGETVTNVTSYRVYRA